MTPQEQIEHERHVANIIKIRNPKGERNSTISIWLNSNVVTALIGVLGTALLGAWVSGRIQERSHNNQLERNAREARLQSQNELVGKIIDRAATFLSASDDLLVTVNEAYREKGRPAEEIARLQKWKSELAERRDSAESQWRREKRTFGFTLEYLFGQTKSVRDTWTELLNAVDEFELCTNSWYTANAAIGTRLRPEDICPKPRARYERAVEALSGAVAKAREGPVRGI